MANANNTGTWTFVSKPWVRAWYASSGNEATPHESIPTAATYRRSTRGKTRRARSTLPPHARSRTRGHCRIHRLVRDRIRDPPSQPEQQRQDDDLGHGEHRERGPIVAAAPGQHGRQDQGPSDGPRLVHGLVNSEGGSASGPGGGVREEGVLGRRANRLTQSLGRIQQQRRSHGGGEPDERHAQHCQRIPDDRPGPVVPAAADQIPGDDAQPVADAGRPRRPRRQRPRTRPASREGGR